MDSERSNNKHPPQSTSKNIGDPAAQFCRNKPLIPTSFLFLSGKFAWQYRRACVRGADQAHRYRQVSQCFPAKENTTKEMHGAGQKILMDSSSMIYPALRETSL